MKNCILYSLLQCADVSVNVLQDTTERDVSVYFENQYNLM
jgi:hypothetical protein